MGARGPLPKPNDRRAGHRTKAELAVVELPAASALPPPPPPPVGLLKVTREEWTAYWTSPVSALVTDTDRPAIERLFRSRDDRERLRRQVRRIGTVVPGSKGQPVLNPLLRQIDTLDRTIQGLEDRFGFTLASRLRLGIRPEVETPASLDELNRGIYDQDGPDGDDDPGDPRLAALQ
jgi:P27 family predicted phage terminase small subunit